MHSTGIVCQVTNQESQLDFTWSSGGGFFRPYAVSGAQLGELRETIKLVRKALGDLVHAINESQEGQAPWERSYELAEAGFRLHNYLLPTEDQTASKIRRWLGELRTQSDLISLEVVVDDRSSDPRSCISLPWNLVYDERPTRYKAAFQAGNSTERWRAFWSIRYNLTSGPESNRCGGFRSGTCPGSSRRSIPTSTAPCTRTSSKSSTSSSATRASSGSAP